MEVHPEQARPCILLVEDDTALRRALQLLLHGRGYEVRGYATGARALAASARVAPVCLVTDHCLTDMTSDELLSRLRAAGCGCPAILITADAAADRGDDVRWSPFQAVHRKPLAEHRLLASVDRAVGRK